MKPIHFLLEAGVSTDPARVKSRMADYVNGRPTDFNSNGRLCYGAVADYIKKHPNENVEVVLLGSGNNSLHGILLKNNKVIVDTYEDRGEWKLGKYYIHKVQGRGGLVTLAKPWVYTVVDRFPASKIQE